MDGAIVISSDFERILHAGVHLVPDGDLPTLETGTRHRTADRVAQQAGVPVVTVSSSMSTIALFVDGERYAIEDSDQILARANQALSALGRYRDRLARLSRILTAREVQDSVQVGDLVPVVQTIETIRRLDAELRGYVAALGIDGRLVELQLFDLTAGVDEMASLLERDYRHRRRPPATAPNTRSGCRCWPGWTPANCSTRPTVIHVLGLDDVDEGSLHAAGAPAARAALAGSAHRWPTDWPTISARCRRCSPRRPPNSWPSTESASTGPGSCGKGWPACRSRPSPTRSSSHASLIRATA